MNTTDKEVMKQKISMHLQVIDYRIKAIKSRKLLKSSWQEDTLLRFQLIDCKKEQELYMNALKSLSKE